jgi:DNA-binding NtrC family response regulator
MSGYDKSQTMSSFATQEHVVFLQKPFKPRQLLEAVQQLLDQS